MSVFYVTVLEANSEGEVFATVPDLPGVNAAAATQAEALALAIEFANDYVRDLVDEGHPVPVPRDIEAIKVDRKAPELGRALIPVEVPGKSVKISMSIDEALLNRADRTAQQVGMSRSGFFADAVQQKIAQLSRPASRGLSEEALPYLFELRPVAADKRPRKGKK